MRLTGKTAVVTGAGSGIGAATARLFASEGAAVVVADVIEDRAIDVASRIVAAGGTAAPIRADVVDLVAVEAMMDFAIATYGALDVVFNNAGITPIGAVDETSEEEWRRVIDINLTGVFYGCKAAIPRMRERGGGVIVNMGSISAFVGFANYAAYAASKGGVVAFTRATAIECGKEGIRVNAVCPANAATPTMTDVLKEIHGRERRPDESEEEYRAPIIDTMPIGRVADPDEIARAVLFLACDDSSFVTGSALVVDGGYTAT